MNFGWAVAPSSYNGKTTAKLHADTFSMLKTHQAPGRGVQGPLRAGRPRGELLTIYGAMPADPAQQQPFIDAINEAVPGRQARLVRPAAMLGYPDIPNHQAWVPDYAEEQGRLAGLRSKYRTTPGSTSTPNSTAEDHPPGHLRRCPGQEPLASSSSTGLPDGPPTAREADPLHRPTLPDGATLTDERDDRGAAHDACARRSRRSACVRPSARRCGASSSSDRG